MQQSQQQKMIKGRKRRMRLLFGIVFAFLLWGGYVYFQQADEINESKKKIAELQKEANQLNAEKADLQKKVEQLQDKEYIAELARSKFFYTKKGEVLFITPDETTNTKK